MKFSIFKVSTYLLELICLSPLSKILGLVSYGNSEKELNDLSVQILQLSEQQIFIIYH